MNVNIEQLLSETTLRPPCPSDELADFIEMVGPVPHQDYLEFIAKHNGCDGPIGSEGYVGLWPVDEVISGTEQANTAEFAPGLLLFGGDGGNEAFAFDRQDPEVADRYGATGWDVEKGHAIRCGDVHGVHPPFGDR